MKQLTSDEMETKLGDSFIRARPQLAYYILSGQTSFSEKGETYALRGSPAASRELVTKDEPLEQRRDLVAEWHAEVAAERAAERGAEAPTPSPLRAAPQPAKPQPVASTVRHIPETGQEARLRCQRADDARRAERAGKRPGTKMASLLSGDEPKGAA